MICLFCGQCCYRKAPSKKIVMCPHLKKMNGFHMCNIYDKRPDYCRSNSNDRFVCALGLSTLGIEKDDKEAIRKRLEEGNRTFISKKEERNG